MINLFSQPIVSYKDELYKANCKQKNLFINADGSTQTVASARQTTISNNGINRLCSGSLESWKILNEKILCNRKSN